MQDRNGWDLRSLDADGTAPAAVTHASPAWGHGVDAAKVCSARR